MQPSHLKLSEISYKVKVGPSEKIHLPMVKYLKSLEACVKTSLQVKLICGGPDVPTGIERS